jgi:hypothetical protein
MEESAALKTMNAATDKPRAKPQQATSRIEELNRPELSLPCDTFGDFFKCSAPHDCLQNQMCLQVWMSRCESGQGSVGLATPKALARQALP